MEGISVQEAAAQLGLNEKTVRRRIHLGQISAIKVPRPQGFEWRVYLDDPLPPTLSEDPAPRQLNQIHKELDMQMELPPVHVDTQVDSPPLQVDAEMDSPPIQVDSNELVRLVEKLHNENRQLAGQVGFLQAKLQDAQEQIRLLEAPREPKPETAKAPWWKRLLWS